MGFKARLLGSNEFQNLLKMAIQHSLIVLSLPAGLKPVFVTADILKALAHKKNVTVTAF